MRLLIIHLSDIHLRKRDDCFQVAIDKMIQGLNALDNADECIIVLSGDLAFSGAQEEYRTMGSLLGAIIKELVASKFEKKHIEIICVPGNHDMDFEKIHRDIDDISESIKQNKINLLIEEDLDAMKNYFNYAYRYNCFKENKIVSKRVVTYGDYNVGFVMLNTVPLSMLGGVCQDMGCHYLLDEHFKMLDEATEARTNILVMHHSIEWFWGECKNRLRKIISEKYSLVLTGHEHQSVGESRNTNEMGMVQFVQGNTLLGWCEEGNGYCTINLNLEEQTVVAHSFIWSTDFYSSKEILKENLRVIQTGGIQHNAEFIFKLKLDEENKPWRSYFVFPLMSYSQMDENDEAESEEINKFVELDDVIKIYDRIVFTGDRKAGKTTIAKEIYLNYCEIGKYPLYFTPDDINAKKIDRIIKYAFEEQYEVAGLGYEKFKQLDKKEKIAIIDDTDLLVKTTFNKMLELFENEFSKIIVFSEDKVNFNIHSHVVEVLTDSKMVEIVINPFWYNKRKELINKVIRDNAYNLEDPNKEINRINDIINDQVKYFNLNPEFIINFVKQYLRDNRFQFMTGTNVFSIVYENSIRNRIIDKAKEMDAVIVLNILRELAFYMHFNKKAFIKKEEISWNIGLYEKTYRQTVNLRAFLNVVTKAKILVESGNKYKFKDHTIVAYFVAQAINQKYNQDENIEDKIEILLKNLCFSINSDIILFLALITDNPKFINIIIAGAEEHFKNIEELDFQKNNVSFLLDYEIEVKDTLPNNEERKQREQEISKQEEDVKVQEIVEIINEYDYEDEDLVKFENQVLKSFKYVEVLAKTLPAFCHNMKTQQQDNLVQLIYKTPNKFLYMILNDICDSENIEALYQEISELRREKNIAQVSIENVRKLLGQISSILVISLYQVIANTSASTQTMGALNAFSYNKTPNYKLINLMMKAKTADISLFAKYAIKMEKESGSKLEKSIIRFTVRNYFLSHNIEIYGESQRLFDYFFGQNEKIGDEKKKMKIEMAKRRIMNIDHI